MGVSGESVTQFLLRCVPRCGSGAFGEGYVAGWRGGSVRVLGVGGATAREPGLLEGSTLGDREEVSTWVVVGLSVGLSLPAFGAAPLSGVSFLTPRSCSL